MLPSQKICHPGTYGFSGKLHAFHLAVVEKFNRFRTLDRLLHFPKKKGGELRKCLEQENLYDFGCKMIDDVISVVLFTT